MTSILFLIQGYEMPSSRVRVLNLVGELEKYKIQPVVKKYPSSVADKIRTFVSSRRYDAVFIQKKLLSPLDVICFKSLARHLIYDFDDAVYLRPDVVQNIDSWSSMWKFSYLVRNADMIIAGNEVLASKSRIYNPNVAVIPSSVETRGIPVRKHCKTDVTVIGWVGGSINLHHLALLTPVFQSLAAENNIQVRILCDKSIDIPGVDVLHIPWRLDTQEKEIARFDIGVMPLPKTRHAEGKCGYKALQYMAAAVPAIVSDVGVNRDIVKHDRTGFVASQVDQFHRFLVCLVNDVAKRERMGLEARKVVKDRFSVSFIGRQLADLICLLH